MLKPTIDGAGRKELEVKARPASQSDVLFRTDGMGSGIDSGVDVGGGVSPVDKFSLKSGKSGSAQGGTISRCVPLSDGCDNAAAGGMAGSTSATASAGRGLV